MANSLVPPNMLRLSSAGHDSRDLSRKLGIFYIQRNIGTYKSKVDPRSNSSPPDAPVKAVVITVAFLFLDFSNGCISDNNYRRDSPMVHWPDLDDYLLLLSYLFWIITSRALLLCCDNDICRRAQISLSLGPSTVICTVWARRNVCVDQKGDDHAVGSRAFDLSEKKYVAPPRRAE